MNNKKINLLIMIFIVCLLALIVGIIQVINFAGNAKPKIFPAQNKILIVNIDGLIQTQLNSDKFGFSDNSSQKALKSLQRAYYDPSIKGILIRINSPGGTVGASQELYAAIARLRSQHKYIVASIADIGASGAYYTASPANYIFANRGALVGSIGVIMNAVNIEDLLNKLGIRPQTYKAGKYKDLLSIYRGSTNEEKILIQSLLNDVHKQFMDDIMIYRKDKISSIVQIAQGQVFTGAQARKLGLIDATGGGAEALEYLARKLGIKLTEANLLHDKSQIWERLLSELNVESRFPDISKLLTGSFTNIQ